MLGLAMAALKESKGDEVGDVEGETEGEEKGEPVKDTVVSVTWWSMFKKTLPKIEFSYENEYFT